MNSDVNINRLSDWSFIAAWFLPLVVIAANAIIKPAVDSHGNDWSGLVILVSAIYIIPAYMLATLVFLLGKIKSSFGGAMAVVSLVINAILIIIFLYALITVVAGGIA